MFEEHGASLAVVISNVKVLFGTFSHGHVLHLSRWPLFFGLALLTSKRRGVYQAFSELGGMIPPAYI